jgi:polar amino acid transport system permease protein
MDFALEMLPYLLRGAVLTVELTCLSMAFALVLGLLLAFGRLSRNRLLAGASTAFVEVIRGTPLLVQLFILYYGLPQYGIRLPAFAAGVLGLGINYGAYLAEVYRAGILSIDRGQWEAGSAIGLSRRGLMRYVILPQALRVVLPPIGNYFISMLKDSSLVATISIVELLRAGQLRIAINFRAMDVYLMVAAIYFLMSYPCALMLRRMERRLSRGFG